MKPIQSSSRCRTNALRRGDKSGAAIVEATLVIGILLMMILGIIEFGRFFSIQTLLNKGAQDAADMAKRVRGFDIDVRTLGSLADSKEKYAEFFESRRQIANAGASLATSTLVSAGPSAQLAKLVAVTITDFKYKPITSDTLLVAALRPGDSASYVGEKEEGNTLDRPSHAMRTPLAHLHGKDRSHKQLG